MKALLPADQQLHEDARLGAALRRCISASTAFYELYQLNSGQWKASADDSKCGGDSPLAALEGLASMLEDGE